MIATVPALRWLRSRGLQGSAGLEAGPAGTGPKALKTPRKLVQLFIASSIFNVWLLRYDDPTPYRGGSARNMREEFAAYGLSPTVM